jgi:hypothetical protein
MSSPFVAPESDPVPLNIELTCDRALDRQRSPPLRLPTRSVVEVGKPRSALSVSTMSKMVEVEDIGIKIDMGREDVVVGRVILTGTRGV